MSTRAEPRHAGPPQPPGRPAGHAPVCRVARPGGGRRRRPGGFTLVELVVVVAIVGVLAAAARPLWSLAVRRQQEQQLRLALRQIRDALDAHKAAADARRLLLPGGPATATGWPASLQALVEGVPLAADPRQRLVLLRRLPRDPLADPRLPAADTWVLRASDSPADAPRPGRDVYDVHSASPARALDGSRYADW